MEIKNEVDKLLFKDGKPLTSGALHTGEIRDLVVSLAVNQSELKDGECFLEQDDNLRIFELKDRMDHGETVEPISVPIYTIVSGVKQKTSRFLKAPGQAIYIE